MSHKLAATSTARGNVKLTGHLAGTADSPTVTNHGTINADVHEVYLLAAGTRALSGDQSFGGNKATNLGDGAADTDGATWGQVLALFRNQDYKASVRVATNAALDAYTRLGAILTADANGSINGSGIDGVSDLALNDRVLVAHGAAGADNGIYYVSQVGDGGNPWKLTRAADANNDAEVTCGMLVPVEEGTANAGTVFRLTTANPITVNTTAQSYSQLQGAVSFGAVSAPAEGAASNGVASTAARSDHSHGTNPAVDGDDLGDATHQWTAFLKRLNSYGAVYHLGGVVTKTFADTGYTIAATDYLVRWNTTDGACSQPLPAAAGAAGRILEFKVVAGANSLTIDGDGAETIDGAATLVIDALYGAVRLMSNGTSWDVLG